MVIWSIVCCTSAEYSGRAFCVAIHRRNCHCTACFQTVVGGSGYCAYACLVSVHLAVFCNRSHRIITAWPCEAVVYIGIASCRKFKAVARFERGRRIWNRNTARLFPSNILWVEIAVSITLYSCHSAVCIIQSENRISCFIWSHLLEIIVELHKSVVVYIHDSAVIFAVVYSSCSNAVVEIIFVFMFRSWNASKEI